MSCSASFSGKKDNGEGGIFFDKEEEKEQWEDDQKVSYVFAIIIIVISFRTDTANCHDLAAIRPLLVHDRGGRRRVQSCVYLVG